MSLYEKGLVELEQKQVEFDADDVVASCNWLLKWEVHFLEFHHCCSIIEMVHYA
jgi:NADH:ubiquinone oxidoreductase subunit B-like Fe-S oxidoreductase